MNDKPAVSQTTREYTREEMREACQNNYNAGWNAALDALTRIIPKLPTYDENGYITKWADLNYAIGELRRG